MSAQLYLFGRHTITNLLQSQPERIITLYIQDQARDMDEVVKLAAAQNIKVLFVSRAEIERHTQSKHHQGIAALCSKPQVLNENDLKTIIENLQKPAFFLILDAVQDPHNLGACFRTAEAAGIDAIIAPKDKAVGITATVSKVASGAAEIVPFVQVTNLARTMNFLKEAGVWLYGADAQASASLFTTSLTGAIGLVLGAEGSGLRRLTREKCDQILNIPMHGEVSSLNVSVAAGIFMFEVVRQRLAG